MTAGKRLRNAREQVGHDNCYALNDAIKLVKEHATAKFDETIEIALNLGVDTRQADQNVRGMVQLPHGTGKSVRVAVFAKGDKIKEAQDAGADMVGGDDLAEKVQKGEIGFDRCIATPDMMAVVGKLGKILGPRGLMPNPKLGTVTADIKAAIEATKAGQVEFRAEKAGLVHAGVGKASFDENALEANIRAFVKALLKAKPSGVKGSYLKRAAVSSTMGPGIKLDVASLSALD